MPELERVTDIADTIAGPVPTLTEKEFDFLNDKQGYYLWEGCFLLIFIIQEK